jgi:hypothetical protein
MLILCVLPLQFCAGIASADESSSGQPAAQADWPRQVVITVGDIRTRIDGPKMWTLSGIDFQNNVMAVQDSAYGTVVTIRGVGHLGTAHFLDVPGKPGMVEKENVLSLQLFVDGQPITQFKPMMNLSGKSFRMERTSKIRAIDLKSSVSIRDGVLIETAHLHTTAPIDLQVAHPLMYAWTPEATVYAFGNDNGIQKRGVFLKEGKTATEIVKDSRWMAVFDPISGKGSVCYLLKYPPTTEGWFLVVDAPGIYRKVALYTLVDKIVPTGFDGTYQCATGFFSATEKDWEQQAIQRAAQLRTSAEGN